MMFLYIDPGTGSMLFTILIGVIGAAAYSLRMLFIKPRFKLGGGKVDYTDEKLPYVIFAESKRYWNVFGPICREMDKLGKDVLYITASPDDPAISSGLEHIKVECIPNENKLYARLNFLNARVVLATTPGLDVYQWKRSKNVDYYVHIPHAASEIVLYRMFGIDYYDAILLSGQYQADDVRKLEAIRGLPEKELELVGIPYMDEMAARLERCDAANDVSRDAASASDAASSDAADGDSPVTVLLAPTWGKSALFGVYDDSIIEALVSTGYNIVIRPHPQSFVSEKDMIDKMMKKYPSSDKLEWNRDNDNFDVLRRSDILISDFSGVTLDFSLVYGKPVIYTDPNFDIGLYDAWWMDSELWTLSALPRIGAELKKDDLGSIKELIDRCLTAPEYEKGRREVISETWVNKGNAAVTVAKYLVEKCESLSQKEGV